MNKDIAQALIDKMVDIRCNDNNFVNSYNNGVAYFGSGHYDFAVRYLKKAESILSKLKLI